MTYAHSYSFLNPDNNDVTHFSYNMTLIDEIWADDDEPNLLSMLCSWPPGAPSPSAVYVELTYASAVDNRVSNGTIVFGSASWG